jgi:adenosine kinase
MKKILVTGSIAYDTIMVFQDRFRNHLLADQLHILNVCFLTPEMGASTAARPAISDTT